MDGVAQQDHVTVVVGVDPEGRAGKTGVAEGGAHLEEIAAG